MARLLRGEVRWAELDPVRGSEQGGRRPVIIISQDVFNERSKTVIAIAVTSQQPRVMFPLSLEIESPNMPKRSWAKIGQIRTMSIERIGEVLDTISPEQMEQLIEGLNEIVGA